MLKYTTAVSNEDGIVSPAHHPEYTRTIDVSAGSKGTTKMAIKRRAGIAKKILSRDTRNDDSAHLPPIAQPGSPQNMTTNSNVSQARKENIHFINQPMKRKEIRTPYVSHVNRISDVATPYVLHTQITNINPEANFARENSKLSKYSGNVVEYKHEPELHHEATFSSLQKIPTSTSPAQDRRPRGRHGRKSNSFNEHDMRGNADIRELTIQSNQMGLYQRTERKRDKSREKGNESFSIRKKIEQFRRWHEEQYREKIKKLKQEVDHQFEAEHNRVSRQVGTLRETPTSKNDMSVNVENEKVPSEVSHEKMEQDKITPNPLSVTNESTSKARSSSARTWKTWRNVNDSYAYNDVQKYIKENELMDEEKSVWIKKWIIEVNKAMKDQHHESIL
ncbi:uncharacterized protein LOC123540760 [Mercenaria mercenaria]|uniref:uncharacterized protein LOC123540760 n=1 Tax=Mercenaria mercenaria TaxID=6596 RepID=UPI00234F6661|nr:uncharacterized protein LOC123540760 [Mercenaria mercenaria]XP_045181960.2 uncharacterized protein LOC123540760 [Mercenaria mercenaria]XP_045181961.2 uncharacterized protein LOC123540760 [Mercenaria mercenaria]XP_045181962.2 uncharacterized protein LOC123540760 [Mercenaria mercenaria]